LKILQFLSNLKEKTRFPSIFLSGKLNPRKTESCVFHLDTHEANRQLDVRFTGTEIQHVEHPKYLGVTLDRSLTYNAHLTKTTTSWGAGTEKLRTAALAIVYSTAEYCAPVWLNSVHISKIDVQLNNAMMGIISGCVKSIQLPWLPTLAHMSYRST
jgi:hypothetical protein